MAKGAFSRRYLIVDSPQKLALVVQANRLQGLIWQALLRSQKLAVILEPANGDLSDCISQIATAGLTLPDIILLDAEAPELNPYDFSRWCREAFPTIQVFLTRCRHDQVSETERRWAIQQGAKDFLDGFQRDTLMSNGANNTKRVLTSIDHPFLDEKSLLMVLLNVRRQLATTGPVAAAIPRAGAGAIKANGNGANRQGRQLGTGNGVNPAANPATAPNGLAARQAPSGPDVLNDIGWVASGLKSLGNRGNNQGIDSGDSLFMAPPALKAADVPPAKKPIKDDQPVPLRRYRGVVY
ncbi:MAG: response regulator [Leptolyngbyaceae cyanobacterium SM2_3_12]|nr:response regulator [Leptolyngbyaceae cyanobacterium SM2_3_12]